LQIKVCPRAAYTCQAAVNFTS